MKEMENDEINKIIQKHILEIIYGDKKDPHDIIAVGDGAYRVFNKRTKRFHNLEI